MKKYCALLAVGKDVLALTMIAVVLYWPVLIVKLWTYSDDLSPADLIQIAILVVLTLTLREIQSGHRQEKQKEDSEAYLNHAVRMGTEAYSALLDDKGGLTASRRAWVTSARLIQRSITFSKLLTLDAHKEIYEAERDILRHQFGMLLAMDVGQNRIFTFFTGKEFHDVWEREKTVTEGVEKQMIPSGVFSTVIRFSTYPENFEDPLEGISDLTDDELRKIWIGGHTGIVRYAIFRKHFIVKFGTIRTNLTSDNSWEKAEINQAKTLLEKEVESRMPIVL